MILLVASLGGTVPGMLSAGGWWILVLAGQLAALGGVLLLGAHRCEVRLTDDEVIDRRIIGTKRWGWDRVGCLAIGSLGRGSVHLVVCILHDPSPHRLRGFPMRSAYTVPVASVVIPIQSHGFPIERPTADAHEWWALDQRAQRDTAT